MFQQTEACIGCHACEVQCKSGKNLSCGPRLCEIVTVGPEWVGNQPRTVHTFLSCLHCTEPVCMAACPTGAIQMRPGDGIVFIQEDLCVGCRLCISACPWGACQWNPETKKVVKCDLCMDRLDAGLLPLCVGICPTGCLRFGRTQEMPSAIASRYSEVTTALEALGPVHRTQKDSVGGMQTVGFDDTNGKWRQ